MSLAVREKLVFSALPEPNVLLLARLTFSPHEQHHTCVASTMVRAVDTFPEPAQLEPLPPLHLRGAGALSLFGPILAA